MINKNKITKSEIAKARQLMSLSPKAFAEAVGVSYRAVVKWELGERTPNGAAQKMIERLLSEMEDGKESQ